MVRLLPYANADGPTNMAADEAMLRSAGAGLASLRFYAWKEATVSLGYFQPHAVRLTSARLAGLPMVRRPTGGATLVHHREITYALALPAGPPWQAGAGWLTRMHRIITAALGELLGAENSYLQSNAQSPSASEGVGRTPRWRSGSEMPTEIGGAHQIVLVAGEAIKYGNVLCFQQFTPGDVLCGGRKIVGSAQRKHRHGFLQHGSILLAQSDHTPELPGIQELMGAVLPAESVSAAVVDAFARDTGWPIKPADWSEEEKQMVRQIAAEKYTSAAWNERR